MSKEFDIPSNKHLGNSNDYWKAPQKNSKQIVVQPLQWLPIDRDENGFATEECLNEMLTHSPFVVFVKRTEEDEGTYYLGTKQLLENGAKVVIKHSSSYTHYLPIPKTPEKW